MLFSLLLATTLTVCGQVTNHSGDHIAAAQVKIQNSDNKTVTDAEGGFCIKADSPNANLSVWKAGFFIKTVAIKTASIKTVPIENELQQQKLQIALEPLPNRSKDYNWLTSLHTESKEALNKRALNTDFEPCESCHGRIVTEWKQSAHANLQKNSLYNLLLQSEGLGIPQQQCDQCHRPVVENQQVAISCDYCHKISEVDVSDSLLLGHQRLSHHLSAEKQSFFGSLDDVSRSNDTYHPLYKQSEYCAGCHQGRFWKTKVYSEFEEWSQSSYATQGTECQDCHMQTTAQYAADPQMGGLLRDSATLSNHHFAVTKRTIQTALEVESKLVRENGTITVTVNIKNTGAGHAIPAGNPMRHLILVLEAANSQGKVVNPVSGPSIPNWVRGKLVGESGFAYGKVLALRQGYEQTGEKRIYPAPFWRNSYIESDNRLRPGEITENRFQFNAEAGLRVKVRLFLREYYVNWLDLPEPQSEIIYFEELLL